MRGSRAFGMCKTGEVAEHIHQMLVQTDVVFFRRIRQRTMQRLGQTQRHPATEVDGNVCHFGQGSTLFLEHFNDRVDRIDRKLVRFLGSVRILCQIRKFPYASLELGAVLRSNTPDYHVVVVGDCHGPDSPKDVSISVTSEHLIEAFADSSLATVWLQRSRAI